VDVQHLYDLLNQNSDWVWEVDAQGRYTWASDVVTSLLGYPPSEVIGKTPFDFMPPARPNALDALYGDRAREKGFFRSGES
jgi:PAS domain S-box-containing protein